MALKFSLLQLIGLNQNYVHKSFNVSSSSNLIRPKTLSTLPQNFINFHELFNEFSTSKTLKRTLFTHSAPFQPLYQNKINNTYNNPYFNIINNNTITAFKEGNNGIYNNFFKYKNQLTRTKRQFEQGGN